MKPIQELLEFSIINVDKPDGHTSFDVVARVRGIFKIKKVGHFGTLDPMVTGVLPIAMNRAVKLTPFFMKKDKTYIGKFRIHSDVDEKKLKREMKKFVGKIKQMPPVKSAVKRQLREREVYRFEIIKKHAKIVEFLADVEAGTYIRKLISDLGENIGGAHMTELRRVKAGIFDIKNTYNLEQIGDAFKLWEEKNDEKELREVLIPGEIISEIIPVVQIKDENVKDLLNGKPLMKKDVENEKDVYKLPDSDKFSVFLENNFIGVYKKVEKIEKEQGYIIAKPEYVLNIR